MFIRLPRHVTLGLSQGPGANAGVLLARARAASDKTIRCILFIDE